MTATFCHYCCTPGDATLCARCTTVEPLADRVAKLYDYGRGIDADRVPEWPDRPFAERRGFLIAVRVMTDAWYEEAQAHVAQARVTSGELDRLLAFLWDHYPAACVAHQDASIIGIALIVLDDLTSRFDVAAEAS